MQPRSHLSQNTVTKPQCPAPARSSGGGFAFLPTKDYHMARNDPDLYWLQVHRSSYTALQTLITASTLQPYTGLLHGPKDEGTWQVPANSVEVISDEQVKLHDHGVRASISRLPTHAYRALIAGSPTFTQYHGIEALYHALRTAVPNDAAAFAAELETVAHSERAADSAPRLVACPTTYSAQWLPHRTFARMSQTGDYFLGLSFLTYYRPGVRRAQRTEVGLDLGLFPLTVAYTAQGAVSTFELTALPVLATLPRLSAPADGLLEHMVYAAGRADAERIIAYLNCHAHTVYAEHLTHRGMSDRFVHRGRAHAVHDHHFSYLSQYLNTSRVDFRRVTPAFTSQICAQCLVTTGRTRLGNRQGSTLTCLACDSVYDAHVNAAHNVLLRGQRLPPRYQKSG